jgi:hypothetical protein
MLLLVEFRIICSRRYIWCGHHYQYHDRLVMEMYFHQHHDKTVL